MNNGPKIHGERYAYTGDFGLVLDRPWSTYERGGHCGHWAFRYVGQAFFGKALRDSSDLMQKSDTLPA